jgi:hypothetical protein
MQLLKSANTGWWIRRKEVYNKMKTPKQLQNETGKIRVFCRYIVKNGKRIYPKRGKFFSFLVDANKAA